MSGHKYHLTASVCRSPAIIFKMYHQYKPFLQEEDIHYLTLIAAGFVSSPLSGDSQQPSCPALPGRARLTAYRSDIIYNLGF